MTDAPVAGVDLRALRGDARKDLLNRMSLPFTRTTLTVDGYDVLVEAIPKSRLTFQLAVYVNGWIRGEDIVNDTEIRRRFYCPLKLYVFPAKQRSNKALRKVMGRAIDKQLVSYSAFWTSAERLLRHLERHNESIRWVNT